MTSITVEYTGDFHCRAVHGPSRSELLTDLPVDNGGQGDYFSPTDLIPTALATCILTIMAKVGDRFGVPLEGARCEVKKVMVSDPERRIGTIRTVVRLPAALTDKQRTVLERAALTCPVHRSLSDRVELPIEFRYE
ncbi:MAG: OsmC family protein [Planctomycetes bacterium]|nr:OsmC family protein [Planctomycetota bacterium]